MGVIMDAPTASHGVSEPGSGRVSQSERSRVQSVDRAMILLRVVAHSSGEDSTVARIAERAGLNRATAWRILTTMRVHGIVHCDQQSGRWSLGTTIVDLARATTNDRLISSSRSILEALCKLTGETAALAVGELGGLTYVSEVVPPVIISATWLGQSVPLHATSTGKVLLAFGNDATLLDHVASQRLQRYTASTVTDGEALLEEIAQVRETGFATCRGEYEASAWGVSAPVRDQGGRLVAVLSVWGPQSRVTRSRFDELGDAAVDAAEQISMSSRYLATETYRASSGT